MKGKLITFEGPEGSGKSTHVKRLAARLRRQGIRVLVTREPGGTPVGEAIRHVLQHDKVGESMAPEAEALLFVACRAQLVRTVILPALKKGIWVLCDRFIDSTTAYQGYGRNLGAPAIEALNDFAIDGAEPDVTIFLNIDVRKGFLRLGQRNAATRASHDRIERECLRFHEKVLAGYRDLARKNRRRFLVVDADRDREAVAADIWRKLRDKTGL
jgi:dTMP kinase